jgi:hypothetical protein
MFPRQADPINPWTIVCGDIPRTRRLVRFVVDTEVTFGENDNARTRNVEFLQCLADDLFGFTVRVGIGLSGMGDVILTIRTKSPLLPFLIKKGKQDGEENVYEPYPMC